MSPLEEDTAATDDQPATKGADPDIPECPNCGELRPGPHCAWCGQNDRDYRRSSWSLIADFFRETFELDSKLFRTLKLLLLKPGRLSAEFSRNRRASFVSPVRLYLFASVIYLFAVSLAPTRDAESGTGDAGQRPRHRRRPTPRRTPRILWSPPRHSSPTSERCCRRDPWRSWMN